MIGTTLLPLIVLLFKAAIPLATVYLLYQMWQELRALRTSVEEFRKDSKEM